MRKETSKATKSTLERKTATYQESALTTEERRARRQERRAKQRAENAGRTAKMHAARLAFEREDSYQRIILLVADRRECEGMEPPGRTQAVLP